MTATQRVVVLGGSSPFTVSLLNEMWNVGGLFPPLELVLFGRNRLHLELVARYGEALFGGSGWQLRVSTELEDALEGAWIVVHQIRYGGLEERRAGEVFCRRFGLPNDETLGAAALRTALRSMPALNRTRNALTTYCPDAWVLNLTNPLSAVTAVLAVDPARTLGLCELPLSTARQTANLFGLRIDEVHWEYAGLNHRGFIHVFKQSSRDLLMELPDVLGDRTLAGVRAEHIRELQAVPEKYYRLLFGESPTPVGRSEYLRCLRERLISELRRCPSDVPRSLSMRDLSWYSEAVVPAMLALNSNVPLTLVVNLLRKGLVEEVQAQLSNQGVRVIESVAPSSRVTDLLSGFWQHEHTFLHAVTDPSLAAVQDTLAADPTIPEKSVMDVAAALWSEVKDAPLELSGLR